MRPPDFIIGRPEDPYLLRWFLIPRNRFLNVFLHKFLRDDEDSALHDHPWHFISIILSGGYRELTPQGVTIRWRFSFAFRLATHRHRVILHRTPSGDVIPAWTIVITGPRFREWGFWCPQGFVSWRIFTKPGNHGEIGRGCE